LGGGLARQSHAIVEAKTAEPSLARADGRSRTALVKNQFPVSQIQWACSQEIENGGVLRLACQVITAMPQRRHFRRARRSRNGRARVKLHFYIGSDDEAERCKDSFQSRTPIAIGGTDTLTGRSKSYNGVVLAVEPASAEAPGERWRITIDTK
jgi:hypothetical protein